jgi:acetyl esterase
MHLHPQIADLLETYRRSGLPRLSQGTPQAARERIAGIAALIGPGPEIESTLDVELVVDRGVVPARRYRPPAAGPGALVWFHGGGWICGRPADYDAVCGTLALATGLEVIAVDYRLAPEHPFPAALEDSFAALKAMSDELDGAGPLVIGGESAGGNIAAVCAALAREHGPEIALQILVYPVTDHDFNTPSYLKYADVGFSVGRTEMEWFWDCYVPDHAKRLDPRASPARAASLEGLPPAYIVIAGNDVLRDEGLDYATRLIDSGVPVELRHYEDVHHGFFIMPGYLDRADEAIADLGRAIRQALV